MRMRMSFIENPDQIPTNRRSNGDNNQVYIVKKPA